jgi:hypothetical protein
MRRAARTTLVPYSRLLSPPPSPHHPRASLPVHTRSHRSPQVLDYGYPQNCGVEVLKMYITQEGNRKALQERAASSGVTIQVTRAVGEGAKSAA